MINLLFLNSLEIFYIIYNIKTTNMFVVPITSYEKVTHYNNLSPLVSKKRCYAQKLRKEKGQAKR